MKSTIYFWDSPIFGNHHLDVCLKHFPKMCSWKFLSLWKSSSHLGFGSYSGYMVLDIVLGIDILLEMTEKHVFKKLMYQTLKSTRNMVLGQNREPKWMVRGPNMASDLRPFRMVRRCLDQYLWQNSKHCSSSWDVCVCV